MFVIMYVIGRLSSVVTEFGKPALQKTICGGVYARVYCIFSVCTMAS